MKWILFLIPALLFATPEAALDAYQAGRYEEALELFQRCEGDSPWLDYNMGSTYLQMGEPAWALYHYERARLQLPRNREIRSQLSRLGPPHPRLLTLERWLSSGELNFLLLAAGLLATLLFLLRLRAGWVPFALALLLASSLLYRELAPPRAVLLHAVDEHPAGSWVTVRRGRSDELEVRLSDGSRARLPADALALL